MRKAFLQVFVLTMLCLSVSACSEPEAIKVGFIGSMTGRASELCLSARDGVQLAVETLNAQGGIHGKRLELVWYDNQDKESKTEEGVDFLADEGVAAIIGPATSQMAVAATPVANKRQVVLISPTSSTDELSGREDYFFRVYPTCETNAYTLAEHAVKESHNQRIAILSNSSNLSFTTPWQKYFHKRVKELGAEISASLTYDSRDQGHSFFKLAREILASRPDGILILTNSIDAGLFSQQVEKLTKGIDLYGSDWAFSGELVQYGAGSVEGFTFTTNIDMKNNTPAFRQFKTDFMHRFDKEPNFPSVFSYEAAQVLFKALKQNPDTTNLPKTLGELGMIQGLQNTFQLDRYGDINRPSYLNQVKNGRFVKLN